MYMCVYVYIHTQYRYTLSLFNWSWQKVLLWGPAGVTSLSRSFRDLQAVPECFLGIRRPKMPYRVLIYWHGTDAPLSIGTWQLPGQRGHLRNSISLELSPRLPPCRAVKHGPDWISDLANLRMDCPA